MVFAWESIREDICRHYSEEGKSLTQVKEIMLRDRGFKASYVVRSYSPNSASCELTMYQDEIVSDKTCRVERQACCPARQR